MSLNYVSAQEAAALVKNNDNVGFSGFTHAGCPKVVPVEIAKRAEEEHAKGNPFKIGVFTGASTGDAIDGALSRAKAIKFRTPYQTNKDLRNAINSGEVAYYDLHLSQLAQEIRYGFLGNVDVAVVEACEVTENGQIVPTTGVGILPTICRMAKIVIVELNKSVPQKLRGLHDMYELMDPPKRREIPIYEVQNRIGLEYVKVNPNKIYVVETEKDGDGSPFAPVDEITAKIGENVADFFVEEIKAGRIPRTFLPVQSGVGNIANAVLSAMGNNDGIPRFEVYTEVIQDAVIEMMEEGNISFASGCSLTVSNDVLHQFYNDLDYFKKKLVLRPSEISNNPGVIRRMGVLALNTAIEVDIFGNVNSTHVNGTRMMNGIGGSGDFTRNAYLSIFLTPSVAKDGNISCIVPKATHEDHSEHSVKIIVTEYGVADLRGKDPRSRAVEIIEKCAHPDYRPLLHEYLNLGVKGHIPQSLDSCFAFHKALLETGSMKNATFSK
ncbi:succinate CoA transferase [Seramator thermalis]|jgi:succinate CoA transferase|uniref:succinate CoA transferase n=1 Tax=Seramator thermalis TaxID=2496270 RepID=UPI00101B7255|nr:succinate CoA transferase [Seramator thermalis]MDK2970029.1 propionyl-CoA:succinyl-CoA transferase [Bacteroidota bacterium]